MFPEQASISADLPLIGIKTAASCENHIRCGRGNVNSRHPGNKKFARLVHESAKDYVEATSRIEKILVVTTAVSFLRNSGMKFMNFDPTINRYVELPSDRVHEKVSHAIRDRIKKIKAGARRRSVSLTLSEAENTSAVNLVQSSAPVIDNANPDRNPIDTADVAKEKTDCNRRKIPAIASSKQSSRRVVREKKRSKTEPAPTPGVVANNKFWTHGVLSAQPSLSPPTELSASTKSDHSVLDQTIFDLGEKIEESALPLIPLDNDIFSSFNNSDIPDVSDLLRLEEKDVHLSSPPTGGGTTTAATTGLPNFLPSVSIVPHDLQQKPEEPTNPIAHGLMTEENSDVHPSLAPLAVGSGTELAEEDLEELSSILLQ